MVTIVPGVPECQTERREELEAINAKLATTDSLRRWNSAIKFTDQIYSSISKFYVIQYDPDTNRVRVEPAARISQGYENQTDLQKQFRGENSPTLPAARKGISGRDLLRRQRDSRRYCGRLFLHCSQR
jgi:hypothetical protein